MPIKPMLAVKYTGPEKLPEDYCVQPKLDGVRCLAYHDGWEIKLQSKTGKPLPCPEGLSDQIEMALSHGRAFLDGELILPKGYAFEQTVSAVRTGPRHELSHLLNYHIYDCGLAGEEGAPFFSRWQVMEEVLSDDWFTRLIIVPTYFQPEDHNDLHTHLVQHGYEGSMYRHSTAPYKHGQSSALIKRKDFIDAEFPIIGHKVAVDQHEGCVVWNVDLGNGRTCEVTPAWSLERRRAVATVAESYYGQLLTVRFQEWTADGSLRFPTGVEVRDYE